MSKYRVSLGYRASIWAHRGCRVSGSDVYTDTLRDARRIVRESIAVPGTRRVYTARASDGEYCYSTLRDMRRDDTGEWADASIHRADDDDDQREGVAS